MPSVFEVVGLQTSLIQLPTKVRDMYFAIGEIVHVLDPDAGLAEYQPIHIKDMRGISDADASILCEVYRYPEVHYMFLRAYSLDLITAQRFDNVIEHRNVPRINELIRMLYNKLPNFNRPYVEYKFFGRTVRKNNDGKVSSSAHSDAQIA